MIEIKDIEKLAELSRLELTSAEKEGLRQDIDSILGYVDQIKKVVVSSGEPEAGLLLNVMREDMNPNESGKETEVLLAEVPVREGQYVKVKKILQ